MAIVSALGAAAVALFSSATGVAGPLPLPRPGNVHAIVQLHPENPPPKSLGYVYMVNGVLPIAPPLRDPRTDAVLVLEPKDGNVAPKSSAPVEVRLFGARAIPEVIIAQPGVQVIFRNEDRKPVTLLCRQAKELFPSTPLPPGARLAVTPPGQGQFDLGSVEYPHLRATLLVPRGPAARLEWSPLGELGVAWLDAPAGPYQAKLFFLHRYVAAEDVTVLPDAGLPGKDKFNEFIMRAVWPAESKSPAAPAP